MSVYGLGRFPVTLYKEQWDRLLQSGDEIRKLIAENDEKLEEEGRLSQTPTARIHQSSICTVLLALRTRSGPNGINVVWPPLLQQIGDFSASCIFLLICFAASAAGGLAHTEYRELVRQST